MATSANTGTLLLQSLRITLDQLTEGQKVCMTDVSEIKKLSVEAAKQTADMIKVMGELNEVILDVKNQISLVGTAKTVKMPAKVPTDIPLAAKNASEGAVVKAPISKPALIKQFMRADVKDFEQISTPEIFAKILELLQSDDGKAATTAAKAGDGVKFPTVCTKISKLIATLINDDDESKQKLTTEFNRLKQSALLENKTPAGVEV